MDRWIKKLVFKNFIVFSIEAAVTNFETGSGRGGQQQRGQGGRDDSQLRARVQFLTLENEELAQVTNLL